MSPINRKLAEAIVDGKVELLGIDEIVNRLGVSRSTLERWVRNNRMSLAIPTLDAGITSAVAGKTNFPAPDVYIGVSPKWTKDSVVQWMMSNSAQQD